MLSARLPLALDLGLVTGPVTLWGAGDDVDPSGLPGPVEVVQTHQPAHGRLVAAGRNVELFPRQAPATLVIALPRERGLARDRIARAVAMDPDLVLVDGQKTDGIDGILKACRARGRVVEVVSKAHGKLFALEGGDFADWTAEPARNADGYLTAPGTFSADGIDPGSALLAAGLPPLSGRVLDLGAGWGYLAERVLTSAAVTECHLVEADHAALACAQVNVTDGRARFHWADATAFDPGQAVDHVVANPPFHRGRKGAPELGRAFLAAAARALQPRGTLWLVANRHLPYERTLDDLFSEVEDRAGTPAYKLTRAARPRRRRR